jgi:uncharacterized protein (TIGR02996 family)
MQRFEFSEGTSNKFWEIAIEGKSVTTRWGRIGTDGQTKTKDFASEAAAQKEYDALVAEKTKKGYQQVGGKAAKAAAPAKPAAAAKPAKAKAPADAGDDGGGEERSSASGRPGARYFELKEGTSSKFWEIHLEGEEVHTRYGRIGADGATTVKEFESQADAWKEMEKLVAEKTKKGYREKTAGGPKSNPDLEAAIYADPEDAQAYLVYADWLQEQGDPRGELITLQHAAASKKDKKVAQAAEKHLAAHADAFLGPLAPWTKPQDGRDEGEVFIWKNGFIHTARLSVDEHGDTEFEGELDQLYDMLVGQPSGKFLVELRVGMNRTSYDNDQQPLIDAMVKKPPRALRVLHIGDFEPPEECEVSWYNIGKLGKLWKVIPQLRHLILHGGSWTLGDLELPEVRRVELKTGGLSKASGDAIAKAKIPKVEHLEIWYGTDDYGGGCGPAQVTALLARTDLPALRWLGLKNADFGDEICKVVGKGKLVKQLTHLDLSMSVLTDDGARALAAHKDALAHLQELNVSDTYVTDEGVKLLKGCAKKVVADDLRDDEDPEYRFVSVGE